MASLARASRTTAKAPTTSKNARATTATSTKPAAKKTTTKAASTTKPKSTTTRTGILDAAAQILAGGKDMNCAEIVEAALARKLWTTKGKTPAATLNAAIHREIKTKGKDARFVKADRGTFKLRKA